MTSIAIAIWVYVDAKELVSRTFLNNGEKVLDPKSWAFMIVVIGIFGLPIYLFKRADFKRTHGLNTDPGEKYSVIGFVGGLILVFGSVLYFKNQSLFHTDVRADVEKSIRATFDEDEKLKNLKITSFNLVHSEGNNYKGLLEVTDGKYYKKKIPVEVVHDGSSLMWELKP